MSESENKNELILETLTAGCVGSNAKSNSATLLCYNRGISFTYVVFYPVISIVKNLRVSCSKNWNKRIIWYQIYLQILLIIFLKFHLYEWKDQNMLHCNFLGIGFTLIHRRANLNSIIMLAKPKTAKKYCNKRVISCREQEIPKFPVYKSNKIIPSNMPDQVIRRITSI